jgi:hypothetical protein
MPTVLDPTAAKINQAIRNCLNRCYVTANPLDALADCVAELRDQPEWTVPEIAQVEGAVRRMLGAMLDDSDNPDADGDTLTEELSG